MTIHEATEIKPRAHVIDGEWICYIDMPRHGGTLTILGYGLNLCDAYMDFKSAYERITMQSFSVINPQNTVFSA